jgi:uncharacterized membrane protein
MTIAILIIVVTLVAWSLHLMQQAMEQREFSLMLAGTLVAMAAAAMVGVYFLMGDYIVYISNSTHYAASGDQLLDVTNWFSIDVAQESITP